MYRESFGSYIRKVRMDNKLPLRKLAAFLDIDQSTLSKIETNQRQPTMDMVPILAKVFKLNLKQLRIRFLSEKILMEIQNEEGGLEALKVAEREITYLTPRKKH